MEYVRIFALLALLFSLASARGFVEKSSPALLGTSHAKFMLGDKLMVTAAFQGRSKEKLELREGVTGVISGFAEHGNADMLFTELNGVKFHELVLASDLNKLRKLEVKPTQVASTKATVMVGETTPTLANTKAKALWVAASAQATAKAAATQTLAKVTMPTLAKIFQSKSAPFLVSGKAHSNSKLALVLGKTSIKDNIAAAPAAAPASAPAAVDSKFFGPPFPADYHQDKRPVIQKSILDKLKGPEQPYPALQSKADFDRDYVKDENSDKGSWKAQFEYDALRNRLAKEQSDENKAAAEAAKEARDVDNAKSRADGAAKDAADAKRGVDEAKAADSSDGGGGGDNALAEPSADALESLDAKDKVSEAEANYEKEQKEFEECKKQLDAAKANLEALKAQQKGLEENLVSETKFWAEEKTVSLSLKKSKMDAAAATRKVAQIRLTAAERSKAEMDDRLARHKLQSEQAHKQLQKQKAEMQQARQNLDKATLTLQKLRGYQPEEEEKPTKSHALGASAFQAAWLTSLVISVSIIL